MLYTTTVPFEIPELGSLSISLSVAAAVLSLVAPGAQAEAAVPSTTENLSRTVLAR
jgi:hypothetical protein